MRCYKCGCKIGRNAVGWVHQSSAGWTLDPTGPWHRAAIY